MDKQWPAYQKQAFSIPDNVSVRNIIIARTALHLGELFYNLLLNEELHYAKGVRLISPKNDENRRFLHVMLSEASG